MTRFERIEKTMKSNVFLSHNKIDSDTAKQIAVFLAAENISVWFDEWEISAGDSIIDEIENGLKTCTHFIILWSKNASKSNWVREELKSALTDAITNRSIKLIPILLDETEKPSLLKDKRQKTHCISRGQRKRS